MNVLQLKEKVSRGIELGAEIVYIKEEDDLYGVKLTAIYDEEKVVFIKSKDESLKSNDFISMIDDIYSKRGDVEVYIGEDIVYRSDDKPLNFLEFAYLPDNEELKMLFLNI
ncbi:MAG: hypothetical protein ACRCXT_17545 [Paraclostridium sp.]